MLNPYRTIATIACILLAIAILSCTSVTPALAQTTNATSATIVGQVNVNGVATNGVSVTIGTGSATTSSYNGVDGVYVITGQPTGTSLPFTATYQGQTVTDTIDPLTAGQQYYEIPAVNIQYAASTATPTPTAAPNATVTPTPAANATVTPTPAANATVTPTPAANATATPTSTVTPTPTATTEATAVPASPPEVPASPPEVPAQTTDSGSVATVAPEPVPAQSTPAPTDTVDMMNVEDSTAEINPLGVGTITPGPIVSPSLVPEPTTARSPGFAAVLAISCLLGAGYLAMRKGH